MELLPLISFVPLLLLQGFFSGSEMALVSASRSRLRQAAEQGRNGARLALLLLDDPERLFTVTLVGQNLANVANTSLMAWYFLLHATGSWHAELMTVALVWPAIFIFAEVLPKAFYRHYSNTVSIFAAPVLYGLSILFRPALVLIRGYTSGLSFLFYGTDQRPPLGATRGELKRLIEQVEGGSDMNREESRLVSKMLDFGAHRVEEAMVPLIQVQGIDASSTITEAIEYLTKVEHSRLPVYDDRVDRIVGILHSFDLMSVQDRTERVRDHMRETIFVPPVLGMDTLFQKMRHKGLTMCVVVNEYGGADGIVTIEDLVEVVVGNIDDEFDREGRPITQIGKDSFLVSGRTGIEEFNELLGTRLPEGDFTTLAGFLLERFQHIPQKFEFLNFQGIQFTVVNATDHSIEQVHVRLTPQSTG